MQFRDDLITKRITKIVFFYRTTYKEPHFKVTEHYFKVTADRTRIILYYLYYPVIFLFFGGVRNIMGILSSAGQRGAQG